MSVEFIESKIKEIEQKIFYTKCKIKRAALEKEKYEYVLRLKAKTIPQ